MIPHHSIASMVSERATLQNPEVRKLADGIIATQKRKIAEMKAMLCASRSRVAAWPTGGNS